MAPEAMETQSHGDRTKADIWSLGCVFIEMLTGQQPWADEDFVSVLYKGAYRYRCSERTIAHAPLALQCH